MIVQLQDNLTPAKDTYLESTNAQTTTYVQTKINYNINFDTSSSLVGEM